MVSVDAFSELLEVLYSAPLDQEQWHQFLTLLCKETCSKGGAFFSADNRLGLAARAVGGMSHSEAEMKVYNEKYSAKDPLRPALICNGRTGVFQGTELVRDCDLVQTEMYRNLIEPFGLRWATILALTMSVRRFEVISLWRGPEQGPMDEDGNHLLGLIFPHVQKALRIRQVLGITQQRLAGAEVIANASSTAAFLLTSRGRVIYANVAAESLLTDRRTLVLQNKSLFASVASSQHALRKLLLSAATASSLASGTGPTKALILRSAGNGRPLQLLANRLPDCQRDQSGAEVLLLVSDPEKTIYFPDHVLRALYNLTAAETEAANGLLIGYSVNEIASLRRVSTGTVRNQVKSIMSKTATSRQSDLMRLLMTLPQPPASS